ncbi:recombinase family protein [Paenibacillus polymyxa]|uniref:recombinase family protein n=1 Tax=Paenibacillus polymyxa TaxID=1406 RepID=UPI003D78BA65
MICLHCNVSRIFKNETYTGNFYFGKSKVIRNADGTRKQVPQPREEWRRIPVPAYITMETYHKIQKRLDFLNKNKPGRPTEDYLLQGICRCEQTRKTDRRLSIARNLPLWSMWRSSIVRGNYKN